MLECAEESSSQALLSAYLNVAPSAVSVTIRRNQAVTDTIRLSRVMAWNRMLLENHSPRGRDLRTLRHARIDSYSIAWP